MKMLNVRFLDKNCKEIFNADGTSTAITAHMESYMKATSDALDWSSALPFLLDGHTWQSKCTLGSCVELSMVEI